MTKPRSCFSPPKVTEPFVTRPLDHTLVSVKFQVCSCLHESFAGSGSLSAHEVFYSYSQEYIKPLLSLVVGAHA